MTDQSSAATPKRSVIVKVQDVTRVFRVGDEEVRALGGVSIDILQGEYLSIMGPSGSGKSTLFNMIGGLDTPTEGKVAVLGVEIAQLNRVEQARLRNRAIGYIFQSYNLIPVMSALQNVALPLLLGGVDVDAANQKAALLLQAVELGDRLHNRPDQLSGGQQQRVAIARAFARDPVIILADEPTGNLDTRTGEKIIDLLSNLSRERGVTIISATHDHKMLSVSDRVVTIRGGLIDKIERRDELKITLGEITTGDAKIDAQAKAKSPAFQLPVGQDSGDGSGGGGGGKDSARTQGETLVRELREGSAALPQKTLLALAMGGLRVRMMRSAVTTLSVVLAIAFLAYTGLANQLARNLVRSLQTYTAMLNPPDPAAVTAAAGRTASPALTAPMVEADKRKVAVSLGLGDVGVQQDELVGLPDKIKKANDDLAKDQADLKALESKPSGALPEELQRAQSKVALAGQGAKALANRKADLDAQVAFGKWMQAPADAPSDGGKPAGAAAQLDDKLNTQVRVLLGKMHDPQSLSEQDLANVEMLLGLARHVSDSPDAKLLDDALSQERLRRSEAELRALLRSNHINIQVTTRGNPMDTWLIVMALLTCMVGIANAMLMSVTERIREIGTMKCLGAQDNLVVKLFLLESVFLGVTGAVLGIVLGVLVALLAAVLQFASYGLANFPLGSAGTVIFWSVFAGVGMSVAAAILPAVIASRKRPVDALRVEE